jgi:hypothetical protein
VSDIASQDLNVKPIFGQYKQLVRDDQVAKVVPVPETHSPLMSQWIFVMGRV